MNLSVKTMLKFRSWASLCNTGSACGSKSRPVMSRTGGSTRLSSENSALRLLQTGRADRAGVTYKPQTDGNAQEASIVAAHETTGSDRVRYGGLRPLKERARTMIRAEG